MSERQEHKKRYNQRLQYIAEFGKWLDREPPILRIWKWRKWKSERPVWKEVSDNGDILIRGMEMPKTCCQCDLKNYDPEIRWDENGIEQIGAWVCKRTREIIWNTQRGENCPLVPLPDGHGRLIDADDLIDEMALAWDYDQITNAEWTGIREWLNHSPTIVPAEGGGENG